MAKNDAELMRKSLQIVQENQVLDEQKPMSMLQALALQAKKAFNVSGADTPLWIGNYANSIYSSWLKQAPENATGEDFIGWFSQSKETGTVSRVEDSFIRRIVFKHTKGNLDEPITKQQVGAIAKELATITGRQALGMTHKLTSKSTPQQRAQAMEILNTLIPSLQARAKAGRLSLNWIYRWLKQFGNVPDTAIKKAFSTYAKMIQQGKLNLAGFTPADFKFSNTNSIVNPAELDALIPIIDDFILAVVIHAGAVQPPPAPPPSPPTPPPTLNPADYAAEYDRWHAVLAPRGWNVEDIKKMTDRIMGI